LRCGKRAQLQATLPKERLQDKPLTKVSRQRS